MAARATYVKDSSGYVVKLGIIQLTQPIADRDEAIRVLKNLRGIAPDRGIKLVRNGRLVKGV